ncbi:ABC transporter ATP-binding protein [Cobetia marina]|uniref:ABC transporter ATP-binding protein n=1 Tax=Cobetia marina TaxID=28258 RepID=UPI0009FC7E9C|nr:ABC transporter ATP-binding protein [Cobetia marina]
MIEINGLYKRYRNHHSNPWILKNVNIVIPAGVSVGLIGANGAGKSTLLRLIAGMDTPDRGEVVRHSRVSWPVGLSGGMQGSLTGRQNVKFVARAQGRNDDVERIVSFVKDFAEIGEAFDKPVKTYSSGMRSRLSFGLSFAFDFDIYISDEATSVGDRVFKAKAQDLFSKNVKKSSIIMVSHSEGILRENCKSGIYIKESNALWFDDIDDALLAYHLDSESKSQEAYSYSDPIDDLASMSHKELQNLIQRKKARLNSLWKVVICAKEAGWPKKEIIVLNTIHKKWKFELRKTTEFFESTSQGQLKKAKQNIVTMQKAYSAIQYSKNELYTSQHLMHDATVTKVIDKAILLVRDQKAKAQIDYESLENT